MPGYWNLKSDIEVKHEITNQLSIKSLDFIGRYIKHSNGFTFFDNIRLPNFSPLPKIKSNKDDKLANAKAIVQRKDLNLKNGSYYHFTSKVIPQNQRVKHNNEFLFTVENDSEITEYNPVAKKFIDSIYERFDKADSANNNDISKALNTITYQINKKPETFIYELLQNADDNAVKDVNVTFYITEKYLLVFHNGEPFKFNNVFAICSVNAEDKSDDIDKIGFKGIGFKSVFKDNDWVFINSGEYSFRFDQSKYSVEKPWQLMPIWTPIDEDLEISLRNNERFLSENVSIALLPKDNDVKLLSKYSKTLELFNDDRILLFLKKVRQVHVSLQNKEKIHCRKNNAIWGKREYTINVNSEIKTWLNEQIRNNNQEVPIKYQDIDKFKITYAYKADNNKVIPLVDSTLFNYLPLSISLGFPFLVNSDFIPDGDREELYLNAWNEYLMIEIGRNLPIFISDIVRQKVDAFNLLPESAKNNFLNSKWNQLYEWFLQGYVESLKGDNPIAFIPSKSGSLETLSNILIDETGLTELLGDTFSQITGISEKLIDRKVGEGVNKIKALLKEYDLSNNIYTVEKLKSELENDIFQKWLKNPINNFNFLEFVFSSSNAELKAIVDTEKIILTEAGELSKAEDIYSSIPNEISFISNNRLNLQLKEHLDKSIVKLRTIEFHATNFLISNREKVNTLLSKEIDILNFWCFVYDYWKELKENDDVKKALRKFYVICKPSKEGELITKEVAATYLSKEIAVEDEVESIIESLKLKDKFFINPVFINNGNRGNITTWLEIFKGAKRGLSDLINELIFQLEELKDDTLHFKACCEIFKYWNKKNKNQQEMQLSVDQIAKLKQYLKIKCIDDVYRASSESIVSEHYQTNKIIDSILLEISLSNQISSDYSDAQIIEWNTFFKEIGCISLEEKQKVFDAKLSHFIKIQDEFQGNHLEFMKELYALYNGRSSNSLDFDFVYTLSKIKLKTSNENWQLSDSIHLSSVFCNTSDLDLQIDLQIEGIDFLSSVYKKEVFNRDFFKKLGVKSGFEFQVFETVVFDKFPNQELALSLMHSNEFEKRRASLLTRFKQADINRYSKVTNYVKFYCLDLAVNQKYNSKFIDFIKKNKQSVLFQKSSLLNNGTSYCSIDNNFVSFIKNHEIVSNRNDELKKPINLISLNYEDYVSCNSFLPKDDFRNFNQIEGANLEELVGIQQLLNESHCIEILSRTENKITPEKIVELDIVKILKGCSPSDDVKSKLFFLNEALDWKPINELFFSYDSTLVINPEQHLHKIFLDIAKDFGINELSEDNLELKTIPEYPPLNEDIQDFYLNKAKFIAFKIDQVNYEEIESNIIEHLSTFKFYEVELVAKVFPKDEPIYEQNLDFYFDEEKKEVIFKGFWKNNKSVLGLLHNQIQSEKIEKVWFDNIINRWDDRKIIETLIDMFGFVPEDWVLDNEEEEKPIEEKFENPFKDIKPDDETFIRGIIKGDFELNEKLDANTTAKIKTLMVIKGQYNAAEIIDEGRFLKAGADEIIVRSAQNGLLYLDVYHWGRLSESNVSLSIYTKSQIEIFKTQEDLIEHTKPQNKFGIVRMPDEYDVDDYNSLDNINDKGKWHYVFIVNENTKAAQNYKEVINLDEYNF
jgi:hypothetical protein